LFGTLPEVAENVDNPITKEKVELGKMLFFDVRLSKDNTQSCNTCHNLNTFGVDNNSFSAGNDGGLGGRNSPTVLNAALHIAQFWDGREPDVEAQAGGPILNPVEMAMPSEEAVLKRLSGIEEYVKLFGKAFPEEETSITYDNLKKAIGAFERKLITPTKFDDYIAGNDDALSSDEKEGLQTYINSGCVTCHRGNLLGGKMYQKFGLYADYWDFTKSEKIDNGKFDVTQNEADKYIFKVPSLRNIEKTAPYFHDGSVQELPDAIRIMAKVQVNKDLSDEEVNKIIIFLNTLTGEVPSELKE
jgi:cytochrome c peroxidase